MQLIESVYQLNPMMTVHIISSRTINKRLYWSLNVSIRDLLLITRRSLRSVATATILIDQVTNHYNIIFNFLIFLTE